LEPPHPERKRREPQAPFVGRLVELRGIEPLTPCLPDKCSPI
jgi:hypothetical protein